MGHTVRVYEPAEYCSIDLMKLIMSVCVVAIHVHPLENCTDATVLTVYNSFVSCAVPFFFLVQGFLLGEKLDWSYTTDRNARTVSRRLNKTLKLYIIWSAIYLPLAIINYVSARQSPVKSVLVYVRDLIFVGEHYNSWILWYLLSAIYAYILILLLLQKHVSPRAFLIAACVCLAASCVIGAVCTVSNPSSGAVRIFQKLIHYTIRNARILRGSYYIPLGICLSRKPLSKKTGWIMLASGFAVMCISGGFINTVATCIASTGLFSVVKNASFGADHLKPKGKYIYIYIYAI